MGVVAEHQVDEVGATTRVRVNGARQHPDTAGLSMATFRQSTSRADDPQLHTHAVISSKVRTADGRWLALDARYLKRNQRMLGGLYQSVLRAEVTRRYGVAWEPVVNGQAEIAGTPPELIELFSKRARQVDAALAAKVAEFRARQGRDPTRWERAALTREASVDTRVHKTGHGVEDLQTRWRTEAAELGWTPKRLVEQLTAPDVDRSVSVTVELVVDHLSALGSTWIRADVLRAICDLQPPMSSMAGVRWAAALDQATDQVLQGCVDLDPAADRTRRRASDGRSLWIEPTAAHITSEPILAEEEAVLTWAMEAQAEPPAPSCTVHGEGLDVLQADAAAAVAGADRLVIVVGPAGTGKTTTMLRAVDDLAAQGRPVFGVAPTAKAAHVLGQQTGIATDTVAKLLYEWSRSDRPPFNRYRVPPATTLLVDESGMVGTASLHRLVQLADRHDWRLVLVGDPHQLQAVGRGGLFTELCASGRVHELTRIHRFAHPWEAAASLHLRAGNPRSLDAYQTHGRIVAVPAEEHLPLIGAEWMAHTEAGHAVAVVASTNEHVDALNATIQQTRIRAGQLDPTRAVHIAGSERAHPGDVIATRRNDRQLRTTAGQPVRNRDLWTVDATHPNGALTVSHRGGHGIVTLLADYSSQHVRLGYAATEHGHQGDTVDVGIALVSAATTHRGLYVATTRGRHDNRIHVVTNTTELAEARDVLETVLAYDRADVPAVSQRRTLAQAAGRPEPVPEPRAAIPEWLAGLRSQLDRNRDETAERFQQAADRQARAATDLADLQPALAHARVAWRPYAKQINTINRELDTQLRPAMWQAHHDITRAGLGSRRGAQRRAEQASDRVRDAEAAIAAIRADGTLVKQHLDALEARARTLTEPADAAVTAALNRLDRDQIHRTDRLGQAIDTWTTWASGGRVATNDLADAAAVLTHAQRNAPVMTIDPSTADRTQWQQLLAPLLDHLGHSGLDIGVTDDHQIEARDITFGLEL